MKKIYLLLCFFVFTASCFAQVGIGTNTPNSKSMLDVQSTSKGVLFPRMTTAQRDSISNPPDGLHIYNRDQRCLNYFDSTSGLWNCYCDECKFVVINITSDTCKLNFYEMYAKGSPAKKYVITIMPGVTVGGCVKGDTALSFATMPFNATIVINNYGTIEGAGGGGGNATIEKGCSGLYGIGTPGQTGGSAIVTKTGVPVTINNYGIVAGGGGGGGGSGGNSSIPGSFGGGGGGGAGVVAGPEGAAGGSYSSTQFGCYPNHSANNPGTAGTATAGGAGGAGVSGGNNGGNGGARGQDGGNGTGNYSLGAGGPAGKAIAGGSGNMIKNMAGGQSFGTVD